jgi:TfdA family taurine catabolism dioxygenase TauD
MSNANTWTSSPCYREPAELMKPIIDPAGWSPETFKNNEEWMYRLSDSEIGEVIDAVDQVERKGTDLLNVSRSNFPLPRFSKAIVDISSELMEGRGFALLRGLPTEGRTQAQTAIAFWGIGSHMGRVTPQNNQGHVLGHVQDLGGDYAKVRGYMTRAEMKFHCDSADILSLCCLHPSKSGGEHRICSSVTLYNRMLESRPDLVEELSKRIYRVRMGKIPPGETEPFVREPTFSVEQGYFAAKGLGAFVLKAQDLPGVPKMSEKLHEAIKVFMKTAQEIALDIKFERGDISYVMNHVTLHSRTQFEDWPEPERKRHLLRLWLSTDGHRPLDPDIAKALRNVYLGETQIQAPLMAV